MVAVQARYDGMQCKPSVRRVDKQCQIKQGKDPSPDVNPSPCQNRSQFIGIECAWFVWYNRVLGAADIRCNIGGRYTFRINFGTGSTGKLAYAFVQPHCAVDYA